MLSCVFSKRGRTSYCFKIESICISLCDSMTACKWWFIWTFFDACSLGIHPPCFVRSGPLLMKVAAGCSNEMRDTNNCAKCNDTVQPNKMKGWDFDSSSGWQSGKKSRQPHALFTNCRKVYEATRAKGHDTETLMQVWISVYQSLSVPPFPPLFFFFGGGGGWWG